MQRRVPQSAPNYTFPVEIKQIFRSFVNQIDIAMIVRSNDRIAGRIEYRP